MLPSAIAWPLALLLATVGAEERSTRHADGVVVAARGHPILLRSGSEAVLVSPGLFAEITGVEALRELEPGDRIRYAWRLEHGGVRIAERLDVDPVVAIAPGEGISLGELEQAVAGGSPLVFDARPKADWEEGHIPGALSLPADAETAELRRAPLTGGPVVIYAGSKRSPEAHRLLRRLAELRKLDGRILVGGIRAWEGGGERCWWNSPPFGAG